MIEAIHPMLVIPGGVATEEDAAAVRAAIPALQAWWEAQGAPLLLLDPKTPHCAEGADWFSGHPWGVFYAVQAWAVQRGYTQRGCKALLLMQGYPDGHGEAGLSVGVVGYSVVADLAAGGERADQACGLLAHEIGHLLGLRHVGEPDGDLMHLMGHWQRFPGCGLSVRPE